MRALLASVLALAMTAPAAAAPRAKTRFDDIRDCERFGSAQFRRHDPAFRRFAIDRAQVTVERFAEKVGSVFVATVYHGRATYDAGRGPRPARFICLHGGGGGGGDALFVYKLPDS